MPRIKSSPINYSGPASNQSNSRSHTVSAGESLASIAQKLYGDARFARLLLTINRGEITIVRDGQNCQACLMPAQIIRLPNEAEIDVYCRHFFTESSKSKFDLAYFARPAMPSDRREEPTVQPNNNLNINFNFAPPASSTTRWGCPTADTTVVDPGRETQANAYAAPVELKRNNARRTDGAFKIADDHELFFSKGTLEVTAMSHYCRVLSFDANNDSSDMVIKLQIFDCESWHTIAAYAINNGTVKRLANKGDGSSEAVTLELPREIARELSIRDFNKNWQNYSRVYLNEKEKNRLTQFISPGGVTQAKSNQEGKRLLKAV